MDLFEAITKRQSYRGGFLPDPVSRDHIVQIVQAGLDAPSGKNEQTTEFVVIDDSSLKQAIQAMHPANKAMQQAQAFIACCVDKIPEPVFEGLSFQVEDCAAAVENMLLACTALGYATVWIDGWLRREQRAETISGLIGLPDHKIVRILLPIGKPSETYPQPRKKPWGQRAWFNIYHKD